jgi:tRNA-2-methylthio-N6-dimethylallyladenosine synthase
LQDHRRLIGRRVEVLVEGPSKNAWKLSPHPRPLSQRERGESAGPVQLTGRTRTDHIVVFDGNPRLAGQTMQIDIDDATSFTLYGNVVTGEHVGAGCCEMPAEKGSRVALPLVG